MDNPWSVALERARKAGIVLADVLMSHRQGHRPITLIGSSLGARVIFYALLSLAERDPVGSGIIQRVVLLGAPIAPTTEEWQMARSVVAGRFINAYCENDWILAFLFRSFGVVTSGIAGLAPVQNPVGTELFLENVNLSSIVGGHRDYVDPEKMRDCLRECGVLVL